MSHDCPHDHCNFFIDSGSAFCPACGLSPKRFRLAFVMADGRRLIWLGLVVAAFFAVLLMLGWWLVSIVLLLIGAGTYGLLRRHRSRVSPFTTLDARYVKAVGESSHWLEKWTELFALNASSTDMPDDERQLVEEAKAAAAEAAAAATMLRNDYGRRYLSNGFDRLDHLAALRPTQASDEWDKRWSAALAIVEHYLDTLWIDQRVADQARNRVVSLRSGRLVSQRRHDLVQLASTVKVLEDSPTAGEVPATAPLSPDLADDEIDAQRRRLRIERQLLSDAAPPEADTTAHP